MVWVEHDEHPGAGPNGWSDETDPRYGVDLGRAGRADVRWSDDPGAPPAMELEPPVGWVDDPGPQGEPTGVHRGRNQSRRAKQQRRAQAREARWQRNRLAVPYRTDGPKVTFGLVWFCLIVAATLTGPVVTAVLTAVVAGLAALQIAFAWLPDEPDPKWWAAAGAALGALGGGFGLAGVLGGVVVATVVAVAGALASPSRRLTPGQMIDVMVRATVPAGFAAASLAGLGTLELGIAISLVLLVSAYEVGDFVVGSGSDNALEGPISGLVALGSILFILWIVAPTPFSSQGIATLGVLAAVCAPLGQILASALLPRGSAWAPALRRLDSYLVSAPLWFVVLALSPSAAAI